MSGLRQIMKKSQSALTGSSPGGKEISVPTVSFVVIGLNEERMIAACLRSVMQCDYPRERTQIIYVDSGSTDGTLQIVQSLPGVKVIHLDDPHPNAAKGRNAGWRAARGEFIQFLDGDMVMEPDWPETAHAFMSQRDDVACVFGQVREEREQGNWYSVIFDRIWKRETGKAATLLGAFFAKRSALAAVNGFDETLNGQEEPALAVHVLRQGKAIWCLPSTMVIHHSGIASFGAYLSRMAAYGSHIEGFAGRIENGARGTSLLRNTFKDVAITCLPLMLLACGLLLHSLVCAAAGILLPIGFVFRIAAREYRQTRVFREGFLYAIHVFIAKYPILYGRLRHRLLHRGDA